MKGTAKQFEGLLDRHFEKFLSDHPTFAVMTGGLASGEGRLGRTGPGFSKHRARERHRALRDLNALPPRELTGEQHLDRLALSAQLLREEEDHQRGRHTMEPAGPRQVLAILLHELLRADDTPKRSAANLRSLLQAAPDYLDESVALLVNPVPLWVRIMENEVAGAPKLLESVATILSRHDSHPGDAGDLRAAGKAFEKYRDRVRFLPTAHPGSFAVGAPTLQRRVRDELGLDYSLGQIEALALAEAGRVGASLLSLSRKLGKGAKPEVFLEEARSAWKPTRPLLELYQEETTRIASAFRASKAVPFPEGDELRVKPVPDFLQALIPTAAYDLPGAFARKQVGIFWVNDLSLTKETEAERLAERQQHFGLPLTCAHEAYPGHHLQFVTANQHPRKWRRLFAHAVFYEGWTLWCEEMMVSLGIDDSPWVRVQQLHDALWRIHRILIDLRLQTGHYTPAQAARHLQKHLGFTKSRSEAEINWYTGQPSVPMSYWLGRLENDRLRDRLVKGRGWSLRQFNTWLLNSGTLPQSWLEKYALD
jgi:uncharacterized protein (DUF885 family)